jgi:hypothetical protein
MVQHLLGRKGAARIALIPPEVLDALNEGLVPTVNLNEFLALDLPRLTRNVARDIGLPADHERIADTLAMLGAFRPVKRHEHVARALYDLTEPRGDRDAIAHALATHPSDVARSWATQWIAFSTLPLATKLQTVRRFAVDRHFGVREMAWMAVRDDVIGAVDEAVWCAQIEALKAQPWRGVELLEPLKADPSRYVQNSVANWLNDAAKTQPDWVREVCLRWSAQSRAPATSYIVRRALRSID